MFFGKKVFAKGRDKENGVYFMNSGNNGAYIEKKREENRRQGKKTEEKEVKI